MSKGLNKAVAQKYKVVGVEAGKYNYAHFGEVDLEAISLDEADDLFNAEFPHLALKTKSSTDK